MNEKQCSICGSMFRLKAMVGEKCKNCAEKHPDVKSKQELVDAKKREFIAELINEKTMRQMVYDILEEAGIKREKCDCGELYFKRSPAQKKCPTCSKK